VRSALLAVKGVTRAQVSLERHEALVTFDPAVATIEAMIEAVAGAAHPLSGPGAYTATVKR
jgi:copper chaperone CopZ